MSGFILARPVRLSTQVNFRRMNSPEVESTVQYSTVQYNVKNMTEEGRRGPARVFLVDKDLE